MFHEFKKFILRGNVVDLAVGVVVGAAFTSVVNAFVRDIVNPLIPGQGQFAQRYLVIGHSKLLYGDLVISILTFLIVAAAVFFLVVQPINKLTEISLKRKDTEGDATIKCPHCLSEIPADAGRCKYCTSKLDVKKD